MWESDKTSLCSCSECGRKHREAATQHFNQSKLQNKNIASLKLFVRRHQGLNLAGRVRAAVRGENEAAAIFVIHPSASFLSHSITLLHRRDAGRMGGFVPQRFKIMKWRRELHKQPD